jgi:Leucine-rich repeat (LRR) protein
MRSGRIATWLGLRPVDAGKPWRSRRALRCILLVGLTLAAVLGWMVWGRVARQRKALRTIERLGGTVRYYAPAGGAQGLSQVLSQANRLLKAVFRDDVFGVQGVSLGGCAVEDVSFLRDLPALASLNLADTPVSDLTPLAGLTRLESLTLGRHVSDLTPLRTLTGLTTLNVAAAPVHDLASLAGLTNLECLMLENTRVADLTPLAGLAKLRTLSLAGTGVTDVSPLSGLSNLGELKLFSTAVGDVAPLKGLTQLHDLDLTDTRVENADGLAGLTRLGFLGLSRSRVDPGGVERLRQALPQCRITYRR